MLRTSRRAKYFPDFLVVQQLCGEEAQTATRNFETKWGPAGPQGRQALEGRRGERMCIWALFWIGLGWFGFAGAGNSCLELVWERLSKFGLFESGLAKLKWSRLVWAGLG